jgi:rod shape-determining protein MreC
MWFSRYRIIWIALLLILMAMAIISTHRGNPGRLGPFDEFIYGIAKPLQWGLTSLSNGVKAFWNDYVHLVYVQQENEVLHRRLRGLEQQITDYRELKALNERLRRLLDFKNRFERPTVAGQVIGDDSTGWFQTLLIDKGRRHGLRSGMPVMAPDGIVGQTIECALGTSKVLLIIDRNSAVDVMIQRSRTRGVLEGTSKSQVCLMKYVDRVADVAVGDRVITSGLGGIFPKGLLVGRVSSVVREGYGLFQKVEVTPHVDFHRLEEVLVVLDQERIPAGTEPLNGSPVNRENR